MTAFSAFWKRAEPLFKGVSALSVAITMITPDPSYGVIRTELPQGRNAARVGPLWRVCEGSY